jgi:uracil-DNA glycosylase
MSQPHLDLLIEIARCPLANPDTNHPCAEIVSSQRKAKDFQLAEPWSGGLRSAPILFLSSNPAISEKEKYPTWAWADERIADFFEHRFGGGHEQWTEGGLYYLHPDGTRSKNWVRFWAAVRQRAAELLQRDKDQVRPGIDYALSEIVHCKSKQEQGVEKARDKCANRYLRRIVAESGAKIIVCLGKSADRTVRQLFDVPEEHAKVHQVKDSQRVRYFAFLPHPNARITRSFTKCLSTEELRGLQEFLRVVGTIQP